MEFSVWQIMFVSYRWLIWRNLWTIYGAGRLPVPWCWCIFVSILQPAKTLRMLEHHAPLHWTRLGHCPLAKRWCSKMDLAGCGSGLS